MKYTIKSQTRTIYVSFNFHNKHKFKLTFPELTILSNSYVFYDEIKPLPFFNINNHGEICFGTDSEGESIKANNQKEFEQYFWNKIFTVANIGGFVSLFGSIAEYENKANVLVTHDVLMRKTKQFCGYWEKHGFLKAYNHFKGKFFD